MIDLTIRFRVTDENDEVVVELERATVAEIDQIVAATTKIAEDLGTTQVVFDTTDEELANRLVAAFNVTARAYRS